MVRRHGADAIAYDSWPIPSVKVMRALGPLVARTPAPAFRTLLATLVHRGHDDRSRASESLRLHLQPYLEH
ncbi:MAG: alpha/beta fold hydrolase, partial [Candidatus Limnocylindria bacterium]